MKALSGSLATAGMRRALLRMAVCLSWFAVYATFVAIVPRAFAQEPARLAVPAKASQKNLITAVPPVYPADAKKAGIQGVVELEAVIDREGNVRELRALSGPGELIESALAAVRQWVYQPTLLNGQAVEIMTSITVNYTLDR